MIHGSASVTHSPGCRSEPIDRAGAIQWILGMHAGWADPWRGRLLNPQGDLERTYTR